MFGTPHVRYIYIYFFSYDMYQVVVFLENRPLPPDASVGFDVLYRCAVFFCVCFFSDRANCQPVCVCFLCGRVVSVLGFALQSLGAGEKDDRDVIAAVEASKRQNRANELGKEEEEEDPEVLKAMAESRYIL